MNYKVQARSILILLFWFFVPLAQADECVDLQDDVFSSMSSSSTCETDADCISMPMKCPFGCELLANKSKAPGVRLLTRRYYVKCGSCPQTCEGLSGKISCRNKRCERVSEIFSSTSTTMQSPPSTKRTPRTFR